jgi:hypothetical protein
MPNAALFVLAGTESSADLGRAVNAMEATKEFVEEGDDVKLVFDGAGTQWIPELEDEDHDYHDLYADVRDVVSVCDYCAGSYGVEEAVDDADIQRLADYEGHPSIRSLVDDDYEIITF